MTQSIETPPYRGLRRSLRAYPFAWAFGAATAVGAGEFFLPGRAGSGLDWGLITNSWTVTLLFIGARVPPRSGGYWAYGMQKIPREADDAAWAAKVRRAWIWMFFGVVGLIAGAALRIASSDDVVELLGLSLDPWFIQILGLVLIAGSVAVLTHWDDQRHHRAMSEGSSS